MAPVALVALGCSGPSPPPVPPADSPVPVEAYFPLIDQSRWTYRIQNLVQNRTYRGEVIVRGRQFIEAIGREGITVEERFLGDAGPNLLEDPEPVLYFRDDGYLERVYLIYQGGKAVPIGFGSEESRFLPEVLKIGLRWDSNTVAFRVGDNFGFAVVHHHEVSVEPAIVKVPAGDFARCLRIDTYSSHGPAAGGRQGEELVFYYADWYAPGVGLVRTQQWGDEEKKVERARIELLDYAIGAPGTG